MGTPVYASRLDLIRGGRSDPRVKFPPEKQQRGLETVKEVVYGYPRSPCPSNDALENLAREMMKNGKGGWGVLMSCMAVVV